MSDRVIVKRAFLHGTTPRITFQIVDPDGVGFQPDTLTLSIFDVVESTTTVLDPASRRMVPSLSSVIVNSRNDLDAIAYVDADGNVEFWLTTDDTGVTVLTSPTPSTYKRHLLWTWTWDTDKVGKLEIVLTIAPDRETVAA
jgi:hypothetical protein